MVGLENGKVCCEEQTHFMFAIASYLAMTWDIAECFKATKKKSNTDTGQE
jgi:hypothetical protein